MFDVGSVNEINCYILTLTMKKQVFVNNFDYESFY